MTLQLIGAVVILIVLVLGARTVERWAGRGDDAVQVRRPPTPSGEISDRFVTQPLPISKRRLW